MKWVTQSNFLDSKYYSPTTNKNPLYNHYCETNMNLHNTIAKQPQQHKKNVIHCLGCFCVICFMGV